MVANMQVITSFVWISFILISPFCLFLFLFNVNFCSKGRAYLWAAFDPWGKGWPPLCYSDIGCTYDFSLILFQTWSERSKIGNRTHSYEPLLTNTWTQCQPIMVWHLKRQLSSHRNEKQGNNFLIDFPPTRIFHSWLDWDNEKTARIRCWCRMTNKNKNTDKTSLMWYFPQIRIQYVVVEWTSQ